MNCNANTNAGSACSQQCCCQIPPIHGNHRCGPSTSVTPPCCWHLPQGYGMPHVANFPYGAYPAGYPLSILGNIHYGPPHVMLNPTGTYPMYSNMCYNQQSYCCNAQAGQRISCCTGRPPMVIPSNPPCNGYCCNDVGAQPEVDKETVEMQKHMTNLWAEVQSVKKPTGSNVGIQVNALDRSVSDHNVNAWDSDADDLDENGGEDNNGDDWGQEDGEETRNPEYDENHHAWDSEEEAVVNDTMEGDVEVNDGEQEEGGYYAEENHDSGADSEDYVGEYNEAFNDEDAECYENNDVQNYLESGHVIISITYNNSWDNDDKEAEKAEESPVERPMSVNNASLTHSVCESETESCKPSTSTESEATSTKPRPDFTRFFEMLEKFKNEYERVKDYNL